eukprot:scpid43890/ scgid8383/ Carotenoid cleavage dioxygenase 8, chloroplastic; AtNCED8; Protein MORE AXILLARY BRANCHING 4; Protein MORE AXILLARY GROWTH 4
MDRLCSFYFARTVAGILLILLLSIEGYGIEASQLLPNAASPAIGFQNLPDNFTETKENLKVRGSLPNWINGSFYSNGGGWWNTELFHWFLGLSVVKVFTISNGSVAMHARFLNSSVFRQFVHINHSHGLDSDRVGHHRPHQRSSIDPERQRVQHNIVQSINTASGVTRVGRNLLLMGSSTSLNEISPATGDTLQAPFMFEDSLPAALDSPSHWQRDPDGNIVHYYFVDGDTPGYQFYHIPSETGKRSLLGPVLRSRSEAKTPFFTDSFGLTDKYILVAEQPALIYQNFSGRFLKDLGTRWHVLSRTSGEELTIFDSPAFFFFHFINAYEDTDDEGHTMIVVDIQTYPNMDVQSAMDIRQLRNDSRAVMHAFSQGAPHRYRLPLSQARGTVVKGERLSEHSIEVPTISYDLFNTRKYRYVYGISGTEEKSVWFDRLIKLDLNTPNPHGEGCLSVHWTGKDLYPAEPVFVPRSSKGAEDDGVVLSIVLDAAAKHSFLLVLDASKFIEIASVPLKFVIPHGFHGRFFHNATFPAMSSSSSEP